MEQSLQRLGVGECWVRDGAEIYFKRIKAPANPFSFRGLGEKYFEQHMEYQKTLGVFRQVIDSEPPSPTPSPESHKPQAKKKKAPRGMS